MSEQRGFGEGRGLRVIVVGHGPSIHSGLGSVIDTMTVLRLKRGLLETHDRSHWGSRTDFLCARSPKFDHGYFPFWLLDSQNKYTTGLCAVLEAKRRLDPKEIFVIGFDRLMHPERDDGPHPWLAHDKWVEHEMLKKIGVRELG